jgi:hypothetical protein
MDYGTTAANDTLTADYDHIVSSITPADYPIGKHVVKALVPDADGTHNAGTNVMEDDVGADIGAVTAFDLLNTYPSPQSGAYVRQSAIGTGNYAEVAFPNVPESVIWGVSGFLFGGSVESLASGNGTTRIVDASNNTLTDIFSGNMAQGAGGTDTQFSTRKMISDPGGNGWSQSDLNGVKARVGFSTNASGSNHPLWRGVMLQYAAPEGITGVLFTKAPTFFAGKLNLKPIAILFQKTPTFAQGVVSLAGGQQLAGVLFTKTPTFPQGVVGPLPTLAWEIGFVPIGST